MSFPYGLVLPYAGDVRGDAKEILGKLGWLLCDGSPAKRELPVYRVIGDIYGRGNGITSFDLPDYRGRFLRATDDPTGDSPAGRDKEAGQRTEFNGGFAGPLVGSLQEDAFQYHTHAVSHKAGEYDSGKRHGGPHISASERKATITVGTPLGPNVRVSPEETRPLNIYVNYILFGGLMPDGSTPYHPPTPTP